MRKSMMAALALSMLFMWVQPAYAVENVPQTLITENPSDQVNGSNVSAGSGKDQESVYDLPV